MKLASTIVTPFALADALVAANAAVVGAGDPSPLAQDDTLLSRPRTNDSGLTTSDVAAYFAEGGRVPIPEATKSVGRLLFSDGNPPPLPHERGQRNKRHEKPQKTPTETAEAAIKHKAERTEMFRQIAAACEDARKLRHRGQQRAALELLSSVKALDPENSRILTEMGHIELSRHNFEVAEKLYRKVLKSHPDDRYALQSMGKLMQKHGKFEEAEEWLKRALDHHPGHAASTNALADLSLARWNSGEAVKWFERTLRAHPNDTYAANGLAKVAMASGNTKEAERLFRKNLENDPKNPIALLSIASIYFFTYKKSDQAVELLSKLIVLNKDNIIGRSFLSFIHYKLGNYSESIKTAFEILQIQFNKQALSQIRIAALRARGETLENARASLSAMMSLGHLSAAQLLLVGDTLEPLSKNYPDPRAFERGIQAKVRSHMYGGGNVFDGETREPVNRLALRGVNLEDD